MRTAIRTALASLLLAASSAAGAFEIYKDYTPSTEVYDVTFVRVNPNRIDDYLEGLKQTWVTGCDAGKNAGVTLDCAIYLSDTAANRDFNLMLVIKQKSGAATDPDPAVYERMNKEIRAKLADDKQKKIVEDYEQMRQFFGDQRFRKIDLK